MTININLRSKAQREKEKAEALQARLLSEQYEREAAKGELTDLIDMLKKVDKDQATELFLSALANDPIKAKAAVRLFGEGTPVGIKQAAQVEGPAGGATQAPPLGTTLQDLLQGMTGEEMPEEITFPFDPRQLLSPEMLGRQEMVEGLEGEDRLTELAALGKAAGSDAVRVAATQAERELVPPEERADIQRAQGGIKVTADTAAQIESTEEIAASGQALSKQIADLNALAARDFMPEEQYAGLKRRLFEAQIENLQEDNEASIAYYTARLAAGTGGGEPEITPEQLRLLENDILGRRKDLGALQSALQAGHDYLGGDSDDFDTPYFYDPFDPSQPVVQKEGRAVGGFLGIQKVKPGRHSLNDFLRMRDMVVTELFNRQIRTPGADITQLVQDEDGNTIPMDFPRAKFDAWVMGKITDEELLKTGKEVAASERPTEGEEEGGGFAGAGVRGKFQAELERRKAEKK
jgi:hypothetical protein